MEVLSLSFIHTPWVAGLLLLLIGALALRVLLPRSLPTATANQCSSRLPPSPPALPIIGHMHLLNKSIHQALHRLSAAYGPLIYLKLGAVPLIVASSADMARQILQTHDQTFSARPQYFAVPAHIFKYTDILFASPGPCWKQMREICATDLMSNKRLEYFRPVRVEEVRAMVRSISRQVGSAVPVRQQLFEASSNIISRMTLGKRMSELSVSASCNIVSIIVEVVHLVGAFNVGDYLPFLGWLDVQGYVKRSKQVHRKASALFLSIIDQRRSMNREQDETLLDLLLTAALNAEQKNLEISDDTIIAVLLEIFIAGIDTVSITIEWALILLIVNPHEMEKVQDELDRVIGPRLLEESDIPNLPYLQAATKEAMRLYPVGPILMPHMSSKPCSINGYDIPAKTMALVNAWAIGRDPTIWEDPLEYQPKRFVGSHIDVRGQHFELLPFSSGRRGCLGWRLGLLNANFILGNLVHSFHWSTRGKPKLTEESNVLLMLAQPLKAFASPKLPKYMYEDCDF